MQESYILINISVEIYSVIKNYDINIEKLDLEDSGEISRLQLSQVCKGQ